MSPHIVYGIHPVLHVLHTRPESVQKMWLAFGKTGQGARHVLSLARTLRIPVTFKDRKALDRHAGTPHHQGVVAVVSERAPLTLEELLQAPRPHPHRVVLLLDRVQDPHNLGAIVRTANAAGADAVVLSRHGSAPMTPAAAKAAAGAMETTRICTVPNVVDAIESLKRSGFWVFGADPAGDRTLFEVDFHRDVCIVLGGEGRGLRPLVKKRCDARVRIPQWGDVQSLNVSVAAALFLYEVRRRTPDRHF